MVRVVVLSVACLFELLSAERWVGKKREKTRWIGSLFAESTSRALFASIHFQCTSQSACRHMSPPKPVFLDSKSSADPIQRFRLHPSAGAAPSPLVLAALHRASVRD